VKCAWRGYVDVDQVVAHADLGSPGRQHFDVTDPGAIEAVSVDGRPDRARRAGVRSAGPQWRKMPTLDLAAKFAAGRADNFDIYLPNVLAKHNKTILGVLEDVRVLVDCSDSRCSAL
jgi:hypothetical protein